MNGIAKGLSAAGNAVRRLLDNPPCSVVYYNHSKVTKERKHMLKIIVKGVPNDEKSA